MSGLTHPAYELLRPVTGYASVLLEHNPGLMTLDGTNTWLLRAPDAGEVIVIDPGEDDAVHRDSVLAAAGSVALSLLTHHHFDHSGGATTFAERTGAPVRALDPAQCQGGGAALGAGEVISAAGLRLRVLATPGHTADSVSFLIDAPDHPGQPAAVLTGDTILGRGTTVIAQPDGDLGQYLDSLRKLAGLGELVVLPGHGPELPDAGAVAGAYLAHREQRLTQVRAALAELGAEAPARAVVEHVYQDVDPSLWPAAEQSVAAQLRYLRAER